MLIVTHILFALASLLVAALAWISPSARRLRSSYALVVLTLVTGTILTVQHHSHLLQSCATGLAYLGLVFSAIIAARFKLTQE